MSVILGSEIARLVFGYLQEEQLDEAATTFCKTSPYLAEEYDWLQRGYRAYKINDLCLVDVIREHCEIKYAVAEYIEFLPLPICESLKNQKSLSGKINSIFDMLTNSTKPNSVSRKRPYSMVGSNVETTQSNDLPGYEPPFKERRLSRKLILHRDSTPKLNSIWTSPPKQNVQEEYTSDDQDEENTRPEQVNSLERSRNETSHYPIFTETILENTQFQNVLVDNINRILESSSDRIDASTESGTNEAALQNNSLQDQVKHAIDNIIMSTERDPSFQQILDDVVQHTAIQEQTRTMSTEDDQNNESEKIDPPVPLKERLRNRSQDKPRPNYNEIDKSSKKKRKGKVEVISNEIVSGEIRDLLHPTTTTLRDSYMPVNQIMYLNSERNMTTFGQDLVYVMPTYQQSFRIDAQTPMFLQDISLANNGASTSLAPGSIINLPTMDQQVLPIQSMLPHVVIKDVVEVNKTKPIERTNKATPTSSKNLIQTKARSLSTPRRQSHVRSLNFTTSDDNENERLLNRRNDDRKSELTSQSSQNAHSSTDMFNKKSSLEEVEQQQDSSDAVDFSKEFDEATVISVELSPATETKSDCSKDEKRDVVSEKKKPQTRRQCQKDLEQWNQMRQMKKSEWDNYLRQTVASTPSTSAAERKKFKRRKSRASTKSSEANVSTESVHNMTTDIEARLLEEALQSAKKSTSTTESTKDTNDQGELKSISSPTASAQKSESKNPPSANKRLSGGPKRLIQIKLPASAKKKLTMSKKRRVRPTVKRTSPANPQKPAAEKKQIDSSQTIDIDLISPIEHPKELNNVVKSGVNLNSFLETPCKDSTSFKFPITPGFAMSSSIKTPGVRLLKEYDSMIKFPEYPTPSFAITPGRTKTPVSQSSSQKDGSSYNRATDYSSGSSYYKPDESDDTDRNIDVLIKENRTQSMASGLGVDPQQNINFCNDQEASDGELSDSSTSSSSSSQSSSSSTCSSSPSSDERNKAQTSKDVNDTKKLLIAQRTQHQLKLEQVRLRTMATIKSDKKIERFKKPKTKISALIRNKVIESTAGMIKRPVQTLKMTGNSTPKIAQKVLSKNVHKPNPKVLTNTPSKRKIATPRRVIYLDYKEHVKTTVRAVSHEKKHDEPLRTQSKDNAKLDTVKPPVDQSRPVRLATPTETIDAIESHIAKTSHSSFVEFTAKSTKESQVDTPKLLQQLQGKSEVTEKTPEMGPPASSTRRATLVQELFGDATMSDSDYMDTPVKVTNDSRTQPNVVPISKANEILKDSITGDSTAKVDETNSLKTNDKRSAAPNAISDSKDSKDCNIAKESKKCKESSNSKDTKKIKDFNNPKDTKDSRDSKDSKISKDYNDVKSSRDLKSPKDSKICKDSKSSKDSKSCNDSSAGHVKSSKDYSDLKNLKDSKNFKEAKTSKDLKNSKGSTDIQCSSDLKNSNDSKNCKDNTVVDDLNTADSKIKDSDSKESYVKESIDKDSNDKKVISKDSIAKDSIVKDSDAQTSFNSSATDKNSVDKDSTTEASLTAQSVSIDSDSESDDDDNDDYDDCTLISSLPISNASNRIYHNVISETEECVIKSNKDTLDLRPVATFLDGRKIVVTTCDEIILYNSAPTADSIQTTPSSTKSSVNKRKALKTVRKKVEVEQRHHKVQKSSNEAGDNLAPEKNARFNIVAKHKGPAEVSSVSRDQRKTSSQPEEQQQQNASTSSELRKSSQQVKIAPLLKDMDINKVLGKIHPSKEIV